jgi:hypothetical protein
MPIIPHLSPKNNILTPTIFLDISEIRKKSVLPLALRILRLIVWVVEASRKTKHLEIQHRFIPFIC